MISGPPTGPRSDAAQAAPATPSPSPGGARRVVVQKYGGSSVANADKLRRVAELVVAKRRQGYDVVVVVSAQGDTTDELLARAKQLAPEPDRRELDMLLSAGERISMALLAIAIRALGHEAVSLTGSQCGIITNASHAQARIVEVRPFRIQDELELGKIVIVAGYQGVSYRRDVTTLGRGGSDTTAVALAAALDAEACEIYSDVDGVYTADPRVVPDAAKLDALTPDEMMALAHAGARVLNATAVEFARRRGIALYARKTGSSDVGTVVRRDAPPPDHGVRGVAHEPDVVLVEGRAPSAAAARALIADLAGHGAHLRGLVLGADGAVSGILGLDDVHADATVRARVRAVLGPDAIVDGLGTVTLVGDGLTRALGPLVEIGALLDALGVAPRRIDSGALAITLLVERAAVPELARRLHAAFVTGR
jgi:aspartate kinase